MSQHLIDTGRHGSAPAGDDRSLGARHGAREHGYPRERSGVSVQGNGSGQGAETEDAGAQGAPAGATAAVPADAGASGAPGAQGDGTLRALDALSAALAEMGRDERLLEERLRHLHRERSQGRSWHDILGEEDPPGTMQLVSRILACLAKASGTLRKELVDALRREGVSIPAIARLFGVTHQRVSNLLRRPSEAGDRTG